MTTTMDRLFQMNLQKEDAELVIKLLHKHKIEKSKQLAQDLNERFVWNYRKSVIQ